MTKERLKKGILLGSTILTQSGSDRARRLFDFMFSFMFPPGLRLPMFSDVFRYVYLL